MKKLSIIAVMTVLFCQLIQAQTPNTCCPPIVREDLMYNLYKTEQTPGLITSPYFLTFKPTSTFKSKMNAYVSYLTKLCPKKFVITFEVFKVSAPGVAPTVTSTHYVCAEWYIFNTGAESIGDVQFGSNSYCVPAESSLSNKWFNVGETYCFKVSLANEPGPNCFSNGCQPQLFWVKFSSPTSVTGMAKMSNSSPQPKLEIYDESGLKLSK